MEAVLSRLKELTAAELCEEFARADLKCGPITPTTRATYERKLARVLAEQEGYVTETDNSHSAAFLGSAADHNKPVLCSTLSVASTTAATSSSSSESAGEDLDFGYGVGLNPPEEEEISVKTVNSSDDCSHSQSKNEISSKPAQVSPTFYFGVCPPWEDVLARNGKRFTTPLVSVTHCSQFMPSCLYPYKAQYVRWCVTTFFSFLRHI